MTKDDVEAVGDLKEHTVYVCGPSPFMQTVTEWLVGFGLPPSRIKQESFNF